MKQVESITVKELKKMAQRMYGSIVKAVVDIKNELLVVDAEMHVDEEQFLLEQGSSQKDLWGINLLPDNFGKDEFIAFDSMVNIRPSQKNLSRGVDDPKIRQQIKEIVAKKVQK